jgi:peptidoglycan/LPS O-acetylase OafA/YrhL
LSGQKPSPREPDDEAEFRQPQGVANDPSPINYFQLGNRKPVFKHPDLWRPEAYRNIDRYQWIDFLRGVGCFMVILHHSRIPILGWFWWILDFFFVISGVLITRVMLQMRDSERPLMEFFTFRAGRLLPALLLFYSVMAVYILGFSPDNKLTDILPYALMYQNTDYYFFDAGQLPRIRGLGHVWSLIVEEHFYLLWGVFGLLFLLRKINYTRLFIISAILLALAMAARSGGLHPWTLLARIDGFVIGSLMGVLIYSNVNVGQAIASRKDALYRGYLAVVAVSLIWALYGIYKFFVTPDGRDYPVTFWFDVLPHAILCSYITLWMLHLDAIRLKQGVISKLLVGFGKISYEAYLLHFPIYFAIRKFGPAWLKDQNLVQFAIVLVATVATAYLVNRFVTTPVMIRRRSLYNALSRVFPVAAAKKSKGSRSESGVV